MRLAAFLIASGFSLAASAADWDIGSMFDEHGHPTQYADTYTEEAHLPRLVEGAPYIVPQHEGVEGKPGCVDVAFLIKADGHTDKFVIVDSKPKGLYDAAVLDSLKFWKFDAKEEVGWVARRVVFRIDVHTGTRVPESPPQCAEVSTTDAGSYPAKPIHHVTPFFPPAMAQARKQGCAVIGFSIINGVADEYEVIDTEPQGQKDFVQAGLQALNRWTFEPGAKPDARGYVAFNFALAGEKSAPPACRTPASGPKAAS